MKLYAISDLHLAYEVNREALAALPSYPEDWLIVAGDVGETERHLRFGLAHLTQRFARVIWAPGNHDLWAHPKTPKAFRGEAKYRRWVAICREHGVLTPEDAYEPWPGPLPAGMDGGPCLIAPLFLLYDYTFRPEEVPPERAVEWAMERDILAADEVLLHPDPYPSRPAWCAERCRLTAARLTEAAARARLVLINHFPLRYELAVLPRVPRFSIWCGTRRTEDWHRRFRAVAVVYGHLHIRASRVLDGVRFEEVSLGYPRDWSRAKGLEGYLREILPGPPCQSTRTTGGS